MTGFLVAALAGRRGYRTALSLLDGVDGTLDRLRRLSRQRSRDNGGELADAFERRARRWWDCGRDPSAGISPVGNV